MSGWLIGSVVRAADPDAWGYVITGWMLTTVVLTGYWLRVRARIRRAERDLPAERRR